ncbi:universal stress protein [Sphaerotilus uruguayifluvii]|uniref:Nucleotide-binding universal stress UspA family protein n=1 Tax=Sphaerotilus uruguayifluvii TaxID=2735897 RepID=A0ABX2FZW9_9BURK|nr:universal stress protein [Leptothrix sp. C29]NRT55575.1 nucleotide-binding universal stress UspA family protein [Leptothrix sp. C29]
MIRILLPLDGSEHALDAVRHVIGLRRTGLDIETVLLNVQEPPHLYEVVLAPDVELIDGASREAGEHALAPAAALLAQAGIAAEALVVTGDAAHEIAEQALLQGCDQIVMTTLSHGALLGRLQEAVSHEVLRRARVPVTLVPPPLREVEDDDLAELGGEPESAAAP